MLHPEVIFINFVTMKRLIILFLGFLFLISSSGIAFSMHYCGKNLGEISFSEKGNCACEQDDMPPGCCSDKLVVIKIKDHFIKSSSRQEFKTTIAESLLMFPVCFARLFSNSELVNPFYCANFSYPVKFPDFLTFSSLRI